jgi:hypothetical protein
MSDEQINDGGPAFPVPDIYHPNGQIEYGAAGMSLRDWFAGQALAGMIAKLPDIPLHDDDALFYIAKRSLMQAEAMLEARKEGAK